MKIIEAGKPCYRANFHTHTTNSDGRLTPAECMRLYRREGYDILALTDHRKLTVPEDIPEGLLMIPGTELDFTLSTQVIHLLGLGISPELIGTWDPKGTPQQAIDAIRACNGLAVLAHPAWSLNDTATMAGLKGLSAVEIWNSVSMPPYNPDRGNASAMLDTLWSYAPGTLLPVMANDDTHFYGSEAFAGWNMVQCDELTVPSVLEAIQAGRFYATQGPEFHALEYADGQLRLRCSPVSRIIFYSNRPWVDKRVLTGDALTEVVWTAQPGEHFIRAELVDAEGHHAWSAPLPVKCD